MIIFIHVDKLFRKTALNSDAKSKHKIRIVRFKTLETSLFKAIYYTVSSLRVNLSIISF